MNYEHEYKQENTAPIMSTYKPILSHKKTIDVFLIAIVIFICNEQMITP